MAKYIRGMPEVLEDYLQTIQFRNLSRANVLGIAERGLYYCYDGTVSSKQESTIASFVVGSVRPSFHENACTLRRTEAKLTTDLSEPNERWTRINGGNYSWVLWASGTLLHKSGISIPRVDAVFSIYEEPGAKWETIREGVLMAQSSRQDLDEMIDTFGYDAVLTNLPQTTELPQMHDTPAVSRSAAKGLFVKI